LHEIKINFTITEKRWIE